MNEREKIIRLWFDMWLKQQDLGIDKIFTEDVVYTESWCPKYENLKTVKHWFNEWNTRGKVIIWDEGYLVGAWFTFPIDEEAVKEKIGLNEQYEEYAIHDTDNFPIAIGEYVSIEELNEMYEMIEELPDYIVECLDEFISHYGTLEEVVEHKDDIYYYPDCETMTDVAYYYIDELQALGDIPPSLQNYIDYEAYGRDLDMGGCFIETSRGMCEIPY